MPRIIFHDREGNTREVEAAVGLTVMEAAVDNNVAGIVAECGGACACATCHAYIDKVWLDKLPGMDDMEDAMLDSALDRHDNSRLSCQIEITDELDGLVVTAGDNES
ncbi:MAG: 2Fe-2S iron-sulfur cluster-binding protein [Gammaproteobacteria bacterium]|jgi:2Fe-2S ferredoxin|nr:2Fe-2S iron-sulfur cluster-binding protein [Gammaproteobacteria bacterium]MDP6615948.1 2Fe-2S iron-sulfur cluster-binding protein [Gammaproteobacteria bacterium]MDP6695013.1 2Fe-2S iron-sulfur cluster-binding protein [Gammaproteobacteria bacterium]MDP7041621.1 2Fe-2S iron-sulfur cluster-binding protein [Gammaproteobacteria bacterium]